MALGGAVGVDGEADGSFEDVLIWWGGHALEG